MDTVGFIFGILAVLWAPVRYQFKTQKNLILGNVLTAFLLSIHYFCYGGYTGSLVAIITGGFSLCAGFRIKEWSVFFRILFTVFAVAILWYFSPPESIFDIAPLMAFSIARFFETSSNQIHTRLGYLAATIFWLIYNSYNNLWAGVFAEMLTFISNLIGIKRIKIQ